jgi:hypothetical protein
VELLGSGAAVADWFGPQARQPWVALLAGAKGVQPLAANRGGGGGVDLLGKLGRVEPLAARQFPGQVGRGDPVADQPGPQLREVGVASAVGA